MKQFVCKPNCGECCGSVPIRSDVLEKKKHLIQIEYKEAMQIGSALVPLTDDGMCIFLNRQTKLCEIYEDRPETCRKYGLVPNLPCLYIAPSGYPRTPHQVKIAQRRMEKNIAKLDSQISKLPPVEIVPTGNKDKQSSIS